MTDSGVETAEVRGGGGGRVEEPRWDDGEEAEAEGEDVT